MIKGRVIKARRLDIAVSEIESAKSPFTKTLKALEVAPPGQAAMIIKPMAIWVKPKDDGYEGAYKRK